MWASIGILLGVVACGSISGSKPQNDAAPMCRPETDMEFCTRLTKNCDSVLGMDNCNQPRTANCGTCSGATPACNANVCAPPECGTSFTSTAGTAVTGVNIMGKQSALLGASESGGSILYLEATSTCVGGGSSLIIADEGVAGTPPYVLQTIGTLASLAGFLHVEEAMTLTADGLTIIGVGTGARSFLTSTRTAVGMIDFSTATVGPFAFINAAIPPSPATVGLPVLSHDGLEFTFLVVSATDTTMNGIYDSVRATTTAAFPAAAKLTGVVQTFDGISGLSSDRLTAFVGKNFSTQILTRTSLTDAFAVPPMSTPPFQAARIVPIKGCATLIGTSEPGNCQAEAISTWTKM
jgi:hypothetical protein